MEHIPILRMGDLLLITIQVDMHDRLAINLAGKSHCADREVQRARRAHRYFRA